MGLLPANAGGDPRQEQRIHSRDQVVDTEDDPRPALRLAISLGAPVGNGQPENVGRDGVSGEDPHPEKREPGKELYESQLPHGARHLREVAEYRHEALAPVFCFSVIGLIFFGRKFAGAEYSPEGGEYEEDSSAVKGELNDGSKFPFRCRIANPEPRKRPWQPGAHHGPHADERGLYGKAERALLVRE